MIAGLVVTSVVAASATAVLDVHVVFVVKAVVIGTIEAAVVLLL